MSRTQDLVLARLRLIAMRWRAESGEGGLGSAVLVPAEQADPAQAGTAEAGPAEAGTAETGPAEAGPAQAGSTGVGEGTGPAGGSGNGSAGPEQDGATLAASPWLRLIALLVGVVALGGAALLVTSWPRQQPDGALAEQESAPGIGGTFDDPFLPASPGPSPSLLVHVVGEVRHPGVVRLPAGSRVVDAVKGAGGLRRHGELGATNLARVLMDGERIEVGAVEGAGSTGSADAGGAGIGPLDLNTATAEQLDTLPGIGPVTAAKILDWRTANGRFTAVDELAEVPGIGPKTLADVRPRVRV